MFSFYIYLWIIPSIFWRLYSDNLNDKLSQKDMVDWIFRNVMLTGTNLVENKTENKKQSTESSYFQLKITTDFF